MVLAGRYGRNYFGRKLLEWTDSLMMSIPLFNKVYAAIKQVNEAFSSGSKNSFKTVVMVEFPREGMYSVGFLVAWKPMLLSVRIDSGQGIPGGFRRGKARR